MSSPNSINDSLIKLEQQLVSACSNGHLESVMELVSLEVDVRAQTEILSRDCPLYFAIRNGHIEVVRFLLSKGAGIGVDQGAALSCTLDNDNGQIVDKEITKLLLQEEFDIHAEHDVVLCAAARTGHTAIVHFLLNPGMEGLNIGGANHNARNGYPLRVAAKNGHYHVVWLLLESGAQIQLAENHRGLFGVLDGAAWNGHVEMVRLLLERGAEYYANHLNILQKALSYAVQNGHTAVVDLLLTYGANYDSKYDNMNRSMLTVAVVNSYLDMVKLLLSRDQDSKPSGFHLWSAVLNRNIELGQLLLNYGVDVHAEVHDEGPDTAFRMAVRMQNYEMIDLLLDYGANPEAHDLGDIKWVQLWSVISGYTKAGHTKFLDRQGVQIKKEI